MYETLVRIIADGTVLVIVVIASAALLRYIPNSRKFAVYSRILMAGLTAFLFAKLIATVYQPAAARPFETLGTTPGASYLENPGFPSDHALFAMAITLAVWFEVKKRWLSVLLLSLTALMCLGRVLALVHTPLDVIGGVLIACIGALWYFNHMQSYNLKMRAVSLLNSLRFQK